MTRRTGLAALLALALGAAACDSKDPTFFRLVGETGSPGEDGTAPVFSSPQPPLSATVVNTDQFSIQVTDPPADGVAGSGVDPESVQATLAGGGSLPIQLSLPTVTIDVAGVPDGPAQVVVSARDEAGNQSVYTFNHVLDRTPPTVAILAAPPADVATSDPSYRAVLQVEVGADPNFATGSLTARTPGADSQCGTADDGALATDILPDPTRTLAAPGTATFEFILDNVVPAGGGTQTVVVCWVARARDTAVDPAGTPGVNESVDAERTTIVFQGPSPTTGTVEGTVTDDGAPVAGATVELLTPTGTVLRTTATDATGFYRFSAVDPGTYRVRSTVSGRLCGDVGVTVTAGETTRANMACPPPGGTIAGQVTSQGVGLPGAVVTASQGGTAVASATTDDAGTYSLPGLPPGAYQVSVTPPASHQCPGEAVNTGVASNQTTVVNFSCDPVATGPPSGDEVAGDWSYTRTRTDATGTCPAPLAATDSGRIAHDSASGTLFLVGLHPLVEMTCAYDPDTGTCVGGGAGDDGAGNTLRNTFVGMFVRGAGGEIELTDEMVVEHVDGSDVTFCTETYMVGGARD